MNQTRVYLFQSEKLLAQSVPQEILSEYEELWYSWQIEAETRSRENRGIPKRNTSKPLTFGEAIKSLFFRKQTVEVDGQDSLSVSLPLDEIGRKQPEYEVNVAETDSLSFSDPITLGRWLERETARSKLVQDEYIRANINGFFVEYFLEDIPEMYWLIDFPGASWLNMQLHDLLPSLPERYVPRVESLFEHVGEHLPPDSTMPLAILNDVMPIWTFFTKSEILDLKVIIEEFWQKPYQDYWYVEEWEYLLSAHERHDYDWLAFYYMF